MAAPSTVALAWFAYLSFVVEATLRVKLVWECSHEYHLVPSVPSKCFHGDGCDAHDFGSHNPNFEIAYHGEGNPWGHATLAEIAFTGDSIWYDISRVKGFNVGVAIKPHGHEHEVVCMDVNCADAYWLCDTSNPNLFNPNYVSKSSLTISFCPQHKHNSKPKATSKCSHTQRTVSHPHKDGQYGCGKNPGHLKHYHEAPGNGPITHCHGAGGMFELDGTSNVTETSEDFDWHFNETVVDGVYQASPADVGIVV